MSWHKRICLIVLLNTNQTSTALSHTLFMPRQTVFNVLCLSLGLTGMYGLVRYLQTSTTRKRSAEHTIKTNMVVPTSTACLLISILALNFPPAWAQ